MIIVVRPTPYSIYIQGDSGETRMKLCRIPGMTYNLDTKAARVPLTPYLAKEVVEKYPDAWMPEEIIVLAGAVNKISECREKANDPFLPVPDSPIDWWPHQKKAFWFLMGLHNAGFRGAGLFSELGSGKSKVAVGIADVLGAKMTLIIGPKSSRLVWHDQFRSHSYRPYLILLPDMAVGVGERLRRIMVRLKHKDPEQPAIIVLNYDGIWRKPLSDWILEQSWDLVIADELHRAKDPGSKISKFMAQLADRTNFRLGVTGTPIHNRPKDVWAQYRFIDGGVYGLDYKQFRRKYAAITGDESASSDLETDFMNKLYSIGFRAKGELDLPPIAKHVIRGELVEAATVYKRVETSMRTAIRRGEVTIKNALTRFMRLQQITSGYINDDDHTMHVLGHEKEQLFQDYIEDFPKGEPLVVFARFHYDLDIIEAAVKNRGLRYSEYSGERDEFNEWKHGRSDVLGVQIRAGAESVDFTRTHYCVYYSMGLSWGDYRQSFKRIHRANQTKTVHYTYLALADTIDERVVRLIENRGDIVQALLDEYSQEG